MRGARLGCWPLRPPREQRCGAIMRLRPCPAVRGTCRHRAWKTDITAWADECSAAGGKPWASCWAQQDGPPLRGSLAQLQMPRAPILIHPTTVQGGKMAA
eukprot:scaffold217_cov377-Prasinococcus_capsulatus_cf.AAC.23